MTTPSEISKDSVEVAPREEVFELQRVGRLVLDFEELELDFVVLVAAVDGVDELGADLLSTLRIQLSSGRQV